MSHQFNRTILREYDVRGIVGSTLHAEDARALGRSYAALAVSEGAQRIAVGRDGRTHSPELEAALIEGLTAGGLDVVRIGMGPSPMLYFAVATLDVEGGIQVTGSHNPADYNGFKMLLNGRSVFGPEIQDLGRRAAEGDWSEGSSSPRQPGWGEPIRLSCVADVSASRSIGLLCEVSVRTSRDANLSEQQFSRALPARTVLARGRRGSRA